MVGINIISLERNTDFALLGAGGLTVTSSQAYTLPGYSLPARPIAVICYPHRGEGGAARRATGLKMVCGTTSAADVPPAAVREGTMSLVPGKAGTSHFTPPKSD